MSNLFSAFDPQALFNIPLNWLSSLGVIMFLPPLFWVRRGQFTTFLTLVMKILISEFRSILANSSAPGILLIPVRLLTVIALNNSLGLTPYTFTASRHLTFTVAIALPLWLGHIQLAWRTTPIPLLAHLVPLGTPAALLPLMVLIEITRSMIRPITLSVRLTANMAAGHLLLGLLANAAPLSSWIILSGVIAALITLSILERAVRFIQAYVFRVLSTLYVNEVNSPLLR